MCVVLIEIGNNSRPDSSVVEEVMSSFIATCYSKSSTYVLDDGESHVCPTLSKVLVNLTRALQTFFFQAGTHC